MTDFEAYAEWLANGEDTPVRNVDRAVDGARATLEREITTLRNEMMEECGRLAANLEHADGSAVLYARMCFLAQRLQDALQAQGLPK